LDVIRFHAVGIPHRFEDLIEHAEISGIPVNDVDFPTGLLHQGDNGGTSVLFGDAAIPVRLQVGAGLNQGLWQIHSFVQALTRGGADALDKWEHATLNDLALWVEQGRSRAHRNNLGWYLPVKRGQTTAPRADQWTAPQWVTA
jgi:2-polyprenyl-6-methoxyphenol hydroxylase-like FAD-dependent oxidoreductase